MPHYQIDVTFTGDDSFMVFADDKDSAVEEARENYDFWRTETDKVFDFVFTATEVKENDNSERVN